MLPEGDTQNTSGIDYAQNYRQYLQSQNIFLGDQVESQIAQILDSTSWEIPQSGLDWNNCGVMALIESANSEDLSDRAIYLEIAVSAFEQGVTEHPLCQAHLVMVSALLGENRKALQKAFALLSELDLIDHETFPTALPLGLIYLPLDTQPPKNSQERLFSELMQAGNGFHQCSLFCGEVILQAQMVFYNTAGLNLLQLAHKFFPNLASVNLRLGVSNIRNNQREGVKYLHRAAEVEPNDFYTTIALAIAYQDAKQLEVANYWLGKAQANAQNHQPSLLNPTLLHPNNPHIYVPYDGLWMTVESSFWSIVTAVLVAEGDWFERELEFWRMQIQPGMVVFDIGANVGVYTFSAARRVGSTGRVFAIEPFSKCVERLQATCTLNHLSQVTIYRGAASDHEGYLYLSLDIASELNEVVTDTSHLKDSGRYEETPCFSLDSLYKLEQLERVDFLKIDAEGHELAVIKGARKILEQHSPTILYENIVGEQASNLPVAEYLQSIGYQLFRFEPFLKRLKPVEGASEFQGSLNLVAIRPK
jgi:FkbM family methyltransferase